MKRAGQYYQAIVNSVAGTTALVAIIAILLLILGNRHYTQTDLTATGRHTLLPQSVQVLNLFNEPIDTEVFIAPDDQQRVQIDRLLQKYARHKADFSVRMTDPALDPAATRAMNIAPGGEIFFHRGDRVQRITQISEIAVTSALQRLARDNTRIATFISGHGERSPTSQNGSDLGVLSAQLTASGFAIKTTTLTEQQQIPVDDGLLIIASPLNRYLPAETAMLLDYLSRGGNLLWLTEPDTNDGLKAVALELGIRRLPGVVVDLATQNLSVQRPDYAIANKYSPHAATNGLSTVTLFPQAAGLDVQPNREWRAAALVQAGEQAWTETGELSGEIAFNETTEEIAGPFPLIIALERHKAGKPQRVVISGDGDFLADAWIGNGGNRDLANRIFNWTTDDAAMINIEHPQKPDAQLNLSRSLVLFLAVFTLLLLPGFMFAGATRVWHQRRYG